MKILHTVESYLPEINGMQEVVKQISERLAAGGHELTIATGFNPERKDNYINGVKIEQFRISGNTVLGYKAKQKEIERYQNFLINSDFDIITNFAAQQWATDLMLPILDKIMAKKVFVPTGFSGLYLPEYKKYFEKMKTWLKLYDMNIFLSNDYRDINFTRENNIERRVLIPNGADEREFEKKYNFNIRKELNIASDKFLILLVGSHTGLKGHNEAIEIFSKADISNACLLIIGRGRKGCYKKCLKQSRKLNNSKIFKQQNKKNIIKALNRQQTVATYLQSNLFLFPSNIECSPIVIFEACASKIPFLSTDVGNVKEIIKWTNGGKLLPTVKGVELNRSLNYKIKKPIKKVLAILGLYRGIVNHKDYNLSAAITDQSAKLLEELFYNNDLRNELANNGYRAWQNRFTWHKIAKQYENLYLELIDQI